MMAKGRQEKGENYEEGVQKTEIKSVKTVVPDLSIACKTNKTHLKYFSKITLYQQHKIAECNKS